VTVLPGAPAATAATLDLYLNGYYGAGLDAVGSFQAIVHGHPEDCTRQLQAYVDAGARHLVVRIGDLEPHRHLADVAAATEPLRAPATDPIT
jgi:hypothetical protein